MMELDTTNHEVLARTLVRAKASRRLVPGSTAGPYFSTGQENARDIIAAALEIFKFVEGGSGLRTRLPDAAQAYRLHQTFDGNVPCLPLTFRR